MENQYGRMRPQSDWTRLIQVGMTRDILDAVIVPASSQGCSSCNEHHCEGDNGKPMVRWRWNQRVIKGARKMNQ